MTPIFEHSFHLKTSLWQGGACGDKITHCVAGDMGLCAFASCLVRRGDVSPAASPSGACGFLRFGRGGWQSTSSAKRESSSISLSRFQVQPSARSIPIGLQFNPSAVFSVNECISFYELRFTVLVLGEWVQHYRVTTKGLTPERGRFCLAYAPISCFKQ